MIYLYQINIWKSIKIKSLRLIAFILVSAWESESQESKLFLKLRVTGHRKQAMLQMWSVDVEKNPGTCKIANLLKKKRKILFWWPPFSEHPLPRPQPPANFHRLY